MGVCDKEHCRLTEGKTKRKEQNRRDMPFQELTVMLYYKKHFH